MASEKTVFVGCKLPNGIVLQHPLDKNRTFELKGLNAIKIVGASFMANSVPADFWEHWKEVHKDFAPLKSGAIFEATSERHMTDKAKELEGERTGLEPMKQDAMNVKPSDGK